MNEEINKCFEQGYVAFYSAKGFSANPYEARSKEFYAWDSGWVEASKDNEKIFRSLKHE